jgi:hypothetical protein
LCSSITDIITITTTIYYYLLTTTALFNYYCILQHLEYIREELLPAISFDAVKLSLACRGKHPEDCNKLQLIDMLHEALVLEKRILGVRLHKRIRQLELEVVSNTRRGRLTMAKSLRLEIEAMWLPLMEIQAEDAAQLKAVLEVKKELDYFKSEQVSSTYTTAMMLIVVVVVCSHVLLYCLLLIGVCSVVLRLRIGRRYCAVCVVGNLDA